MSPAVRLLAIRHAPVAVEGVAYGRTDVPTTVDAAEAARLIESSVSAFAPGTIWSSDALRCSEPAAMLSGRLGVPHRIDPRLREISFGAWEGRAWAALPKADVDEWLAGWRTRSPPGGESVPELMERVTAWWRSLEPGAHFLMAHAGVVQCLDVVAGGLAWDDAFEHRLGHLRPKRFARDGPAAADTGGR